MYIGYNMSVKAWKELIEALKKTEGVRLSYYPEMDKDGYFVDYKFLTIEYNGVFYYMDASNWNFSIDAYKKVSPFEKQQIDYPMECTSIEDIFKYMSKSRRIHRLENTYKQRIYLLELYGLSNGTTQLWKLEHELAGNREKEILNNLDSIEMVRHDKDYEVLRFYHKNRKEYFDYECKSHRITG